MTLLRWIARFVALCGATVRDHFGTRAPAMDRCPACMRIARDRGLGRPGWALMGS